MQGNQYGGQYGDGMQGNNAGYDGRGGGYSNRGGGGGNRGFGGYEDVRPKGDYEDRNNRGGRSHSNSGNRPDVDPFAFPSTKTSSWADA